MPLRKSSLSAYIRNFFYFYTLSKTLWFQVAHSISMMHILMLVKRRMSFLRPPWHMCDHELEFFLLLYTTSPSISCSLFLSVFVELMILKYYLTLGLYRWMDMQNVVNTVKYYLAVKIFLNNMFIWKVYFLKRWPKKTIFSYMRNLAYNKCMDICK